MSEISYFAIDCFYESNETTCCCVHFLDTRDRLPVWVDVQRFAGIAKPYKSGEFFRTELPFLMKILRRFWNADSIAMIDGYVWLRDRKPGLGAYLFEALGSVGAIIGVAKNEFVGSEARKVIRGKSSKPLFVSSIGIEEEEASNLLLRMSGNYRIPTMLKLADAGSRLGVEFDWHSWLRNTE